MVIRVYQMLLTKSMLHFSVKQLEQQMSKFLENTNGLVVFILIVENSTTVLPSLVLPYF